MSGHVRLKSKEHYDLIDNFERLCGHTGEPREPKEMWAKGFIYCNGHVNSEFISFRAGYVYAKAAMEATP